MWERQSSLLGGHPRCPGRLKAKRRNCVDIETKLPKHAISRNVRQNLPDFFNMILLRWIAVSGIEPMK
jgi:hypothetical protein